MLSKTTHPSPPAIVLIGYGNQQHGDDAIGPQIASLVDAMNLSNVKVHGVTQLTPELSGKLAEADYAIFVKACKMSDPADVRVTPLQAIGTETSGSSTPALGHSCDPQSLLALTQSVYGRHPQAWWVEVPATDFVTGHSPSDLAQQGLPRALQEITTLVAQAAPE
ncbi:MAG: hydrogenase expression protein HypE [Leptolyngbya sp. SIO1E4]|nr:hydrogenase expression protein HypE [Leptolyngbya sp. SIO1E4]